MIPPCMTPDEYAAWQEANERLVARNAQADSPCRDCLPAFAREMRGKGMCARLVDDPRGRTESAPGTQRWQANRISGVHP